MLFIKELDFINTALSNAGYWDRAFNSKLTGLNVPHSILSSNDDLASGDVKREWAKWYIDQFVKADFFTKKISSVEILHYIREVLKNLSPSMHISEVSLLAEKIFYLVEARIYNIKNANRYRNFSPSVKQDLLDSFSGEPRCWYSGIKFTSQAIDRFLGEKSIELTYKPQIIDKYLPIGLNENDFAIEIDHIFPFSKGGCDDVDNLRLTLRWINRRKQDYTNIYDGLRKSVNPFYVHYYWIIRFMGLYRRCSVVSCANSVDNTSMKVASINKHGPLNPLTIRLFCPEHDPIHEERYITNSENLKL